MKNQLKIMLNTDLVKFKKGHILTLECDEEGIPFNPFWRRRLLDAVIDNCVTVIDDEGDVLVKKQKSKDIEGK